MKVVFVSKECPPSPRSSGIGSYVWETGHALAQVGHEVTIIAASDDGQLSRSVPSPRMTVIRLPDEELGVENRHIVSRTLWAPYDEGMDYRMRIADCLEDLVNHHQVDVVEFPGFRGESVVWLTRKPRFPMVVRMHGFTAGIDAVWKDSVSASRRLKTKWECCELDAADIVTAVSEQEAFSVRKRVGADRLKVVHNSIDTGKWRALSAKAPQELDGKGDILFAGALVAKKGIYVLLRAANLLRQAGWRGRLILAGRSTLEFERFIRLQTVFGRKLPDWVVTLGICQRERLAGLYRDAAVCCLPSLLDPFPYTCLEAMTCGGVVVGSLETGMAEALTETCGFVTAPGDVSELFAALSSALSMSEGECRRMREAAQQRVCEHFDNSVIIPKLLEVYEAAQVLVRGSRC